MSITIHNLPAKHKALMEVIWEMQSTEQIVAFVQTLPWKDKLSISYLVEIAQLGGDDLTDVTLAKKELDRIAAL